MSLGPEELERLGAAPTHPIVNNPVTEVSTPVPVAEALPTPAAPSYTMDIRLSVRDNNLQDPVVETMGGKPVSLLVVREILQMAVKRIDQIVVERAQSQGMLEHNWAPTK